MTETQRSLCMGMVELLTAPPRVSKADFLRQFPSAVVDGKLALTLLEEAYRARDGHDLECAMVVGYVFGFSREHSEILCHLADADWHTCHEDIIFKLDRLRVPSAVETFFRATQWIPPYLDWDDARALAVKAIWGLGNLPGDEAEAKLKVLADSSCPILRRAAAEQLDRRGRRP